MNRQPAVHGDKLLVQALSGETDLLRLHEQGPDKYPFLLQSTARGPNLGQYDILFACPGDTLVLQGFDDLQGKYSGGATDFLQALDDWWSKEHCAQVDSDLPFSGGWFIYLGYELAAQIEPRLPLGKYPVLPTAFAVRCPAAVVRRHADHAVFALCEADRPELMQGLLSDALDCVDRPQNMPQAINILKVVEDEADFFIDAVLAAKQYIAAGDIYQANLSRSWRIQMQRDSSATEVYRRLSRANPAPFAGLVRWNDTTIASSSPERLVAVRDGQVSTRPIAGTRPRDKDKARDTALIEELLQHPKERAEHVMLIDLERNDLGRICRPGTVQVDEYMVLESYAHVHHIVSSVVGTLNEGTLPGEVIRAVFPGGTITGCPKIRCMEIIAELENEPRGAYTGSFGYLNRDGSLDLNILIRTMVIHDGSIHVKAGSGIVADSEPAAELAETRAKAKGLLMAISG